MYRYFFVADEVLSDETQQHSTGRGVFYLKLMNKTSWQEHCWQISGALVAALCQDPVLKLAWVHDKNNNSCIMFIMCMCLEFHNHNMLILYS